MTPPTAELQEVVTKKYALPHATVMSILTEHGLDKTGKTAHYSDDKKIMYVEFWPSSRKAYTKVAGKTVVMGAMIRNGLDGKTGLGVEPALAIGEGTTFTRTCLGSVSILNVSSMESVKEALASGINKMVNEVDLKLVQYLNDAVSIKLDMKNANALLRGARITAKYVPSYIDVEGVEKGHTLYELYHDLCAVVWTGPKMQIQHKAYTLNGLNRELIKLVNKGRKH